MGDDFNILDAEGGDWEIDTLRVSSGPWADPLHGDHGAAGDGTTDDGAALQSAFDESARVRLAGGGTYLLDSSVFLDSAAALGTSLNGTYLLEGDGRTTLKLGANMAKASSFSESGTAVWALFVHTERTALSAGTVTVSDGNRTTSGTPRGPRLVVRNLIIDWDSLNAGVSYGDYATMRFEDCIFVGPKYLMSWRSYTDGHTVRNCSTSTGQSGSFLVVQEDYGDGITIDTVKGTGTGLWKATKCNGGSVRNCVGGQFDFTRCHGITINSWHHEQTATNIPTPGIKVNNSHVVIDGFYGYAGDGAAEYIVRIDDTSDSYRYSDVVLRNFQSIKFLAATGSDTVRSPDIHIAAANEGTRLRLEGQMCGVTRSGQVDFVHGAPSITSDVAGITTALASARGLVAGPDWELHYRNAAWEVTPLDNAAVITRQLAQASVSAITANTSLVGTLTNGQLYEYMIALRSHDGEYALKSGANSTTPGATQSVELQINVKTPPAELIVWRKAGTGVNTAPDAYVVLPIGGPRTKVWDTGTYANGVAWITSSVPVPNTVAAANTTFDSLTLDGRRIVFGGFTAAPTAGTWVAGDVVWFDSPAAASAPGAVCTAGGSPGTWKDMAALAV